MKNVEIGDRVFWVDPDTLCHHYCILIGRLTEYSSLVQFNNYEAEIDNCDLRTLD